MQRVGLRERERAGARQLHINQPVRQIFHSIQLHNAHAAQRKAACYDNTEPISLARARKRKKHKLNDKAKAKQLQCTHTHTQTGTQAQRVTHRHSQAHSHSHSKLHAALVCTLRPLFSMSAAIALPFALPLPLPQPLPLLPLLAVSAPAFYPVFARLLLLLLHFRRRFCCSRRQQSKHTDRRVQGGEEGKGSRARERERECRQNNMFVWIISYVALRSLRRDTDADATLLCVRKQLEQAEVAWRRLQRRRRRRRRHRQRRERRVTGGRALCRQPAP